MKNWQRSYLSNFKKDKVCKFAKPYDVEIDGKIHTVPKGTFARYVGRSHSLYVFEPLTLHVEGEKLIQIQLNWKQVIHYVEV